MDYLGGEGYGDTAQQNAQNAHAASSHAAISQLASFAAGTAPSPHTPSQPHQALDPYIPGSPSSAEPLYDPSDPYNGMPPPPPFSFPTLEGLMAACQEHGRTHGYACVTSSNNYKRGIAYVRCDRGGEYVNHWNVTPETRVRKNRTRRLVGCRWKARAKRNPGTGEWSLTMMEDKHNSHGPSRDLSRHPSLRQLPEDAVQEAKGLFAQGRTPKEVLERLKAWNACVTAQDVYNLKAKIHRSGRDSETGSLGGRALGMSASSTPSRAPNAAAEGKQRKTGTSTGKGGRKNGGATASESMDVVDDSPLVDPALRIADPSVAVANMGVSSNGIERLTEAVAQMQDAGQMQLHAGDGHDRGKKCNCTCCDH